MNNKSLLIAALFTASTLADIPTLKKLMSDSNKALLRGSKFAEDGEFTK